ELRVERRLRELALLLPEVALDADEPVADDHLPLRADERCARIVLSVVLEDVHRVVRVSDEIEREERAHAAELDDVSVLAEPGHERADDVVLESERVAEDGVPARTRHLPPARRGGNDTCAHPEVDHAIGPEKTPPLRSVTSRRLRRGRGDDRL